MACEPSSAYQMRLSAHSAVQQHETPSKRRGQFGPVLATLSPDVLAELTSLLEAPVIVRLILCGNSRLNASLRHQGVRKFALQSLAASVTTLPFPNIVYSFRQLQALIICCRNKINAQLFSFEYVEVDKLPNTLKELRLPFDCLRATNSSVLAHLETLDLHMPTWGTTNDQLEPAASAANLEKLLHTVPNLTCLTLPRVMTPSLLRHLPPTLTSINIGFNFYSAAHLPNEGDIFDAWPKNLLHLELDGGQDVSFGKRYNSSNQPDFVLTVPPTLTSLCLHVPVSELEDLVGLNLRSCVHLTSLECTMEFLELSDAFAALPPTLTHLKLDLDPSFYFPVPDTIDALVSAIATLPRSLTHLELYQDQLELPRYLSRPDPDQLDEGAAKFPPRIRALPPFMVPKTIVGFSRLPQCLTSLFGLLPHPSCLSYLPPTMRELKLYFPNNATRGGLPSASRPAYGSTSHNDNQQSRFHNRLHWAPPGATLPVNLTSLETSVTPPSFLPAIAQSDLPSLTRMKLSFSESLGEISLAGFPTRSLQHVALLCNASVREISPLHDWLSQCRRLRSLHLEGYLPRQIDHFFSMLPASLEAFKLMCADDVSADVAAALSSLGHLHYLSELDLHLPSTHFDDKTISALPRSLECFIMREVAQNDQPKGDSKWPPWQSNPNASYSLSSALSMPSNLRYLYAPASLFETLSQSSHQESSTSTTGLGTQISLVDFRDSIARHCNLRSSNCIVLHGRFPSLSPTDASRPRSLFSD